MVLGGSSKPPPTNQRDGPAQHQSFFLFSLHYSPIASCLAPRFRPSQFALPNLLAANNAIHVHPLIHSSACCRRRHNTQAANDSCGCRKWRQPASHRRVSIRRPASSLPRCVPARHTSFARRILPIHSLLFFPFLINSLLPLAREWKCQNSCRSSKNKKKRN